MAIGDDISRHRVSKGFVAVVVLVAVAYVCRFPHMFAWIPFDNVAFVVRIIRDAIHIGVPLGWVISVRRRVIQVQVRRYLTCVGLLIVFWILVRTLKFRINVGFEVDSLLWYLYYFPILFIPVMCLFAFMSMGKPESFRLSRRLHLVLAIPAILFALTLTNNLTQWAFVFLTDPPSTANLSYARSFVYFADMAWVVIVVIACLVVLIRKSQLLTLRQAVAIMGLLLAMVVYLILYTVPAAWIYLRLLNLSDITLIICLFIMAVLELCLRFRIIQNNTHYVELFARIDTPAVIFDEAGRMRFVSEQMPSATEVQLWQAQSRPIELEGGTLVEGMPIKGGYIVWTKDISQIKAMQSELKAASEQLAGENDMLRAEVELKERMAATETRNRLYDDVVREVSPEIERLDLLADSRGATLQERMMALKRMCVIGAYIKRRSNLIFLAAEHDGIIAIEELYYCLRESADALGLMDVKCSVSLEAEGFFDAEEVKRAYDSFERRLEALEAVPPVIGVVIRSSGDSICLDITMGEVQS